MLFDSHAHLDDRKFDSDRSETIAALQKSGVSYFVNIGADMESSESSVALAEKYDFVYAAVGVHPYDAETVTDELIEKLRAMAQNKKVVAIGESGLDYHYEDADKQVQKNAFIKHIELANELDMPVIVHNRDSHQDMMDILREHKPKNAIIHCYSGSAEMAKEIVKMGYYISFSGTVTFKNARKVQEAVAEVPLDKLLAETDSPYICPEPERGKRNDPSKMRYTVEKLAEIKGITFEEMARITLENAKRVYNIE